VAVGFNDRPDLLMLDSGGHMGHVEFRYVIDAATDAPDELIGAAPDSKSLPQSRTSP